MIFDILWPIRIEERLEESYHSQNLNFVRLRRNKEATGVLHIVNKQRQAIRVVAELPECKSGLSVKTLLFALTKQSACLAVA
jgi:hypothetical protein